MLPEEMPECADGPPADAASELLALRLNAAERTPRIVPAAVTREWMNATAGGFAKRCLPLLMANQHGWFLLNPHPFRASWDGGDGKDGLTIEALGDAAPLASSIFGYGILTWDVGYLFRTPASINLMVRGPSNLPKDGIAALEGVVETDWAVAPFTMSWKFTRPGHSVVFAADEPFAMITPIRRHEIERLQPRVATVASCPELERETREFERRRAMTVEFRRFVHARGGESAWLKVPFEQDYMRGRTALGQVAPEHQCALRLKPFQEVPAVRGDDCAAAPASPGTDAGPAGDGTGIP